MRSSAGRSDRVAGRTEGGFPRPASAMLATAVMPSVSAGRWRRQCPLRNPIDISLLIRAPSTIGRLGMWKHSPAGRSVVLRSVSAGVLAQVAGISVSHSGAGNSTVADQVLTYDGTDYGCTGVAETRDDPRWQRYPLKLVFATDKGEYLADVRVKIEDASGNIALEAAC